MVIEKGPHICTFEDPLILSNQILAEEEAGFKTEVVILGYAKTLIVAQRHGFLYS
jgi:hypothetical protein